MPNHTGPWKRGKGSFATKIVTDGNEQQQTIAELWYFGHDRETIQANACLIAAAPDLLAACEAVLRYISSHQVYDKDARGVLERAVAKARGEEQASD